MVRPKADVQHWVPALALLARFQAHVPRLLRQWQRLRPVPLEPQPRAFGSNCSALRRLPAPPAIGGNFTLVCSDYRCHQRRALHPK